MRRFSIAIVAALSAFALTQTAYAADLPVKALVYKAPAFEAVPTWTGFYIGAHLGGAFGSSDWYTPGVGVTDSSIKPSGFIGGGQIGYNYQINHLVLGVEADGSWSNLSDTGSLSATQNNCFSGAPQSCTTKADWFATLTARLGYAWNRALIYAKGGAAWGHFKYENPCPGICFGAPENWYSSAKTRSGWTAGGGIEYQWNNRWSVNLEYDYLDFGTSTAFFVSTLSPAADFNENIRNRVQMVTVGANYRFGGSP